MKTNTVAAKTIMFLLLSTVFNSLEAHNAVTINDGWKFNFSGDSATTGVHLPHSWNEDAYTTRDYRRGKGIYSKQLAVPARLAGRQVFLRFDGAASKSEVFVDGKPIGQHVGAYSPHTVNITPHVLPGTTHEIRVEVDNSDPDVPPYSADFSFMGGIYRDAWLIDANPIHLDFNEGPSFKVTTTVKPDGSCQAVIDGKVANSSGKKDSILIDAFLISPDGRRLADKTEKLHVKNGNANGFRISFANLHDVELWSPESPALYKVELMLRQGEEILDTATEMVGFRSFGFDGEGRFLLNHKPYKLRGMCRHQDQKPMGIALSDSRHRRDIEMIKDMGANFIRISHYPQDDAVVDMCDRLGLIAWEEIPVIDFVPESKIFAGNCETMLREMIRSHFNHPSIVMWGYMNEILLRLPRENQEETKQRTFALASRLENVVREEDASRLSTMAFHGSDVYNECGMAGLTDVKGWNLYSGWYGGNLDGFEEFLSAQHRNHPSHRLIVSEYGAGSDLRIHSLNPEPFDFSMEYQQKYLEHYLPVIEDSAYIAGASHWNFIDFSSANRAESMPHINNKGLVTNDRRKKDVYYYYKSAWHDPNSDTVVHIASRDWAERTEITGADRKVVRPIKVYTNLPSISMRVNGKDYGAKHVSNNFAVFDVILKEGNNVMTAYHTDNPDNILDAMVVSLLAIPSGDGYLDLSNRELAINVGSDSYFRSDDSGITWLPDRVYVAGGLYGHIGGQRGVSQDEISRTSDGPLMQRSLSDIEEYRVDVADGHYEVELSFADLSSPSALSAYMLGHNAGSHDNPPANMDIEINGKRVESGFSPAQEAGVKNAICRRYFAEAVGNGGISVKFFPTQEGSTLLSAIKIRKL